MERREGEEREDCRIEKGKRQEGRMEAGKPERELGRKEGRRVKTE